jgi:fermentation-respiration switch protein FrsA (DUF1100 family)
LNLLLTTALLGSLTYGALTLFLFTWQEQMVFLPTTSVAATPAQLGLTYEDVRLHSGAGVQLQAWYVPAADPEAPVVLFFHGNAGNISHRLDTLGLLHGLGLSTLIIDYRGYGNSTGRPTEPGLYQDALAAWRYLVEERAVPPEHIVLHGRSLGAAVAAWLATQERPGALILESAFLSVPELGAHHYPWLPVRLLARIRFPLDEYLRSVQVPVLVVHSPADEIVPFAHGRALYAAAREPRAFLEIRGGHNEGFLLSGAHYREGLRAFLKAHVPPF